MSAPLAVGAGQRGQGVVDLELARHLERDLPQHVAMEAQVEGGMAVFVIGQAARRIVASLAQAEGEPPHGQRGEQAHDALVVAVSDGGAVGGQEGEELAEGLFNMVDVAVEIEVVGVNVEHDGHRGAQVEEAGVELARLGHKHAAPSDVRAAADKVQRASNMDGGVHAALHEHLGEHGGGGGLSVRAAHADGGVKPLHQLAQQRRPLNGRQAQALQLHALGVVGQNGHGVNHQIRAVHVFGMVADGDGNVQVVPQVAGGVGFQIV